MCGIYGMVSFRGDLRAASTLEAMGRALRHRGPDDHLLIADPKAALGTERLRITDLRPEAIQPFIDPSSRVWLSCNGAVYNAVELRNRYSSYPFRSDSDVEVLLPLFLDRGPDGFANVDGMFAVAIWDGRVDRLILARDRAGEKPLFYAQSDREVWFASEVQALLAHNSLNGSLDHHALASYLFLGYVPQPRTMFHAIRKLEAGTVLMLDERGSTSHRYWQPAQTVVEPMSATVAEQRLRGLLEQSVEKQLQADVPVGVFTSGGLDSALLAAIAARVTAPRELHTFTVGFPEASFDERAPATCITQRLGTQHLEVCADEQALREALDVVTHEVAEPIADPAILPTYLLARAARERVGVVLSGEGADELFGGYPTYIGHRFAPWFAGLPASVRAVVAALVELIPPSSSKIPIEFLLRKFVAHAGLECLPRHIAWFGTGLPREILDDGLEATPVQEEIRGEPDELRRVMLFDYVTYLPDNLLAKVDRATMLASLEARSPYLDREVMAFGLALDPSHKLRQWRTKWLLKRVAERWLPRSIVHRRKRGLSVPISTWLNEGLRAEVDRLFFPERIRALGLNSGLLSRLLYEHRSRQANHGRALWALVVLERWRERWAMS
ncbi:MAG: asparagine synthase (glutamine-hydrolyzing) [Gemmatimonadales bacterium]|jgi:asparagine synthase (glutamine-hydrolysing)